MSEQLVASAANASRLVDSAEGILEARTVPKASPPSRQDGFSNDSSSHNLKLFWDGQRMAQTIPSLNQQISDSAMENNRELDRMAAEVAEQEMLAVDMRHRMEPLLQSVDKVHAGGRASEPCAEGYTAGATGGPVADATPSRSPPSGRRHGAPSV